MGIRRFSRVYRFFTDQAVYFAVLSSVPNMEIPDVSAPVDERGCAEHHR